MAGTGKHGRHRWIQKKPAKNQRRKIDTAGKGGHLGQRWTPWAEVDTMGKGRHHGQRRIPQAETDTAGRGGYCKWTAWAQAHNLELKYHFVIDLKKNKEFFFKALNNSSDIAMIQIVQMVRRHQKIRIRGINIIFV